MLFNNIFEDVIPDPAVSGIVSVAVSTVIVLTFGEIPKKSQSFDFENLTVVVNKLTARKIIEIKVHVNPVPEDEEEQEQKFKLFEKPEKEESND